MGMPQNSTWYDVIQGENNTKDHLIYINLTLHGDLFDK